MHSFGHGRYVFLARSHKVSIAIALFFLLIIFYLAHPPNTFFRPKGFQNSRPIPSTQITRPQVCRHLAVASVVGWHFEIYMSIVGVLEKELCPHPNGSVNVYTPETFGYGFDNIINELGLYHGHFSNIPTFFDDMESTSLFPEDEGSPMIDMIFLGTCESE
jgi:hypothetical protein